ncbi:protein kinase domain-containing protein [Novipirellula artificiosorum]|uniref:Serine/threonine-protein kinase PknJ n=1 Tax=Novipirellula artificiosorum TaxID=2528016 RepID=A0A5C6CTP2_9BACT|nr:protein kinase [Novipirellula artificiosorum]TWU27235.1 Serine/threonine-protein kinase PknJ [Novipirellula artificiosorum]
MSNQGSHSSELQYQEGQEVVPGYTLVHRLGKGFSGDVWKGRAAGGTEVAIKVVRSLSDIGGRKELKALKALRNIRHPNLCPVHGFWTKDSQGNLLEEGETSVVLDSSSEDSNWATATMQAGSSPPASNRTIDDDSGDAEDERHAEQLIVVMGLGDCTLHDRLQQVRLNAGLNPQDREDRKVACGLEPKECVLYLREAAKAIDLLNHSHAIYHCDVKPQNILLVGGGVQVCDFGLANKMEGDSRLTRRVFASPAYAAPEVLGGQTYSSTMDQYALAVTYFELRTGLLPFDITTEATIILAKGTGNLDLNEVTSPERKVLRIAMQADPKKRFDSCTDLIKALAVASGVEKSGGAITLPRLIAGCVLLVAMIVGSGFLWRSVAPESWGRFTGRGVFAAEVLFEQVRANEKDFGFVDTESQVSFNAKVALHQGLIRNVERAFSGADPELKMQIRTFTLATCQKWVDACHSQLVQGGFASPNDAISKELDIIETVLGDSKLNLLDLQKLETSELKRDVLSARVQIAALDRQSLTPELELEYRNSLPRGNPSERESIAIVCRALLHHDEDALPGHYADGNVLSDLEAAQQVFASTESETLPAWSRKRWGEMEGGKNGFIAQLKQATERQPRLRERITRTWPDIFIDADLNAMKRKMVEGQWDDFADALKEFQDSNLDLRDLIVKQKSEFFGMLSGGLEVDAPQDAGKLLAEVNAKLSQVDPSVNTFFLGAMSPWVNEVLTHVMAKAKKISLDDARAIHQEGLRLVGDSPQSSVPAIDSLLLMAAINVGPKQFDDAELNGIIDRLRSNSNSPLHQLLTSAISLEIGARRKIPFVGNRTIADLQRQMEQLDAFGNVSDQLPAGYFDYLRGLISICENAPADAANLWYQMQTGSNAETIRNQLAAERCEWIAGQLLELATIESGVKDHEVLQLRFMESNDGKGAGGAERVDQAKWWLQPDVLESGVASPSEVVQRYRIQDFVLAVATAQREGKFDSNLRTPSELQLLFDPNTPPLARNGQFFRAAFQCELAFCQENTGDVGAHTKLLQATVAVTEIALMDSAITKRDTLDNFLRPAMDRIEEDLRTGKSSLPDAILTRFAKHYLNIGRECESLDLSSSESSLRRLERLERSAATLARLAGNETSKAEQVAYLISAAEFLQQRQRDSGNQWTPEQLEVFSGYVENAKQIDAQDPNVAVADAFLEYHYARSKTDPQERTKALKIAASELAEAVERLEQIDAMSLEQLKKLYQVYVRHANTVVLVVFEVQDEIEFKSKALRSALASAEKARDLLSDSGKLAVTHNEAYMAIGNSSEDLAFYCDLPAAEKKQFYLKAIQAFEQACKKTNKGESMKARSYLARCRFRYAKEFGLVEQMRLADGDLGELDPRESSVVQADWLYCRAQIRAEIGNLADAIDDVKRACSLLRGFAKSPMEQQDLNDYLWFYADCLKARGKERDDDNALRILVEEIKNPGPKVFWKWLELRCAILVELQRLSDVIEPIKAIPQQRYDDLSAKPQETTRWLAQLSFYLRRAGFESPAAENLEAIRCLNRFQTECRKYGKEIGANKVAQQYALVIDANERSLSSDPLVERIQNYLNLLRETQSKGLDSTFRASLQGSMYDQLYAFVDRVTHRREIDQQIDKLSAQERVSLREQLLEYRDYLANGGAEMQKTREDISQFTNLFLPR